MIVKIFTFGELFHYIVDSSWWLGLHLHTYSYAVFFVLFHIIYVCVLTVLSLSNTLCLCVCVECRVWRLPLVQPSGSKRNPTKQTSVSRRNFPSRSLILYCCRFFRLFPAFTFPAWLVEIVTCWLHTHAHTHSNIHIYILRHTYSLWVGADTLERWREFLEKHLHSNNNGVC